MVSHTTRLVCYAIPLCPGPSHPDTKVRVSAVYFPAAKDGGRPPSRGMLSIAVLVVAGAGVG
eukprot:scaffold12937_cov59-Phaeocystis_antarctica.AAC.1